MRMTLHDYGVRQSRTIRTISILLVGLAGFVFGSCERSPQTSEAITDRPILTTEVWPLAGNHLWDFGVITLDASVESVHHVFTLKNESETTVKIVDIKSTCGCTAGVPDKTEVHPGDVVNIAATLRISRRGVRSERLYLMHSDGEQTTLTVSAIGYRESSASTTHYAVDLVMQDSATVTLISFIEEPDLPPTAPEVVAAPSLVEVSIDDWKPVGAADDSMQANRHHCILSFKRLEGARLSAGDFVELRLFGEQNIKIYLDGGAWHR